MTPYGRGRLGIDSVFAKSFQHGPGARMPVFDLGVGHLTAWIYDA